MTTLDWVTCRICCCPYPEGGRCPRSHGTGDGDGWTELLAAHLPEPEEDLDG